MTEYRCVAPDACVSHPCPVCETGSARPMTADVVEIMARALCHLYDADPDIHVDGKPMWQHWPRDYAEEQVTALRDAGFVGVPVKIDWPRAAIRMVHEESDLDAAWAAYLVERGQA